MVRVWLRRFRVDDQFGLAEEAGDQVGPVLDAFEQGLDRGGELVDGDPDVVAQVAFDVGPHAFDGVEVGGVGGQGDHGQPVGVAGEEPAHRGAAVGVEVVPTQDDRSTGLVVRGDEQGGVVVLGEATTLALTAVVGQDPVEQPGPLAGPVADQGCHRDPPGALPGHSHGRGVSPWGPGPGLRGSQALPGFVLEDDPRAGRRR